jgi:parvulin-like peptidyl-prolyl isomerase
MLEQMRKSSQSLLIYVLFGIVIAVFIINFGPQSRGGSCESTMADEHYAATIGGDTISRSDYQYAFRAVDGNRRPVQQARMMRLKEQVMDKLLERELLATEARRLGYVVSDEQVEKVIADGRMIAVGFERPERRMTKDGTFNYDAFKAYVQFELGITPNDFIEQQRKELMAGRVRELFRGGLTVSPNEVKSEYLRKGTQVNLEYLRFASRGTEEASEPTDAEIDAYLKANEAKVKALYDERKIVYEKVPKELHLRQIMVKIPEGANADAEKAAQKKAEAIAARVKKGEPFAKVAKETTEDTAAKPRAGDLGWRGQGAANLPAEPEKQLLAAKVGDIVGPLKGSGGFYITKVEGSREGNVPFDNVKRELAAEKLRTEKAGAEAKSRAEAALAKAKAEPAKTLKDLFPAPAEGSDKGGAANSSSAPRAEETGLFAARGNLKGIQIEGIGVSNELGKAAFALTTATPLAGPFEVADSWIVVRLKERKDPDLAEFEKQKSELVRDAERDKWEEVMSDWARARCVEVKQTKGIRINRDVLKYEDNNEPPQYEPCAPPKQFIGG